MKKKTKIVLALVTTAAVGGAIWYMRKNKKANAPVIAPVETTPSKTANLPAPTLIEEIVFGGSVTRPATTQPVTTTQPVSQPVYTTPVIQPVAAPIPIPEPIAKVYPAIQPIMTQPIYTRPLTYLTKADALLERERALAGVLL